MPCLHSFRACSQLACALSDNPALQSLVKGVQLCPSGAEGQHVSAEDRANLRFILALDGLQHVALGGLLAVQAEKFLRVIGDPESVLELHIDGSLLSHALSFRPSLEWDEWIAFQFTHLKTLRLTNIDLDISYPSTPYQLQLYELRLDNVTIMSGYISYLVHETPFLSRLCVRSSRVSEFDAQIRLLLDTCGIEILELEVEMDGPWRQPIFDSDLPLLSSLHSLHLAGVQVDFDMLISIGRKCRNLEHLSILGRTITVLPSEWVSFISAGYLERLRSLGLPWGTRYPPFARWSGSAGDAVLRAAAPYNIHVLAAGPEC
ncbi:hypothetical protein LshimejAT787_0306360 [Lyophyllum shimeji]|uniref:Uncharacterized protein n=1 Tax=Lyophyllum shimeji TaxID=47721 RepID=A0A9P3PJ17_LYOSH|nr:hypothetical protein LshimejAT787_0306360 [Lyophyllum shimeji]